MKKNQTQTTSRKIKFKGTESFINKATGEIVEMQVTDIEDRDFNFHKLWLKNIINTLDIVGNQKTKLAFWIIEHLDKENQLTLTYRQICDEYNKSENRKISLDTIAKTMKILLDSDFLRKKNAGCYIVNPDVIYKGTRVGRLNVLNQFHNAEHIENELNNVEKLQLLTKNVNALQETMTKMMKEINKLTDEMSFEEQQEIFKNIKLKIDQEENEEEEMSLEDRLEAEAMIMIS